MNLSWIRNPQVSAMLLLGAAIVGTAAFETELRSPCVNS